MLSNQTGRFKGAKLLLRQWAQRAECALKIIQIKISQFVAQLPLFKPLLCTPPLLSQAFPY
jgi:hypothetical protein